MYECNVNIGMPQNDKLVNQESNLVQLIQHSFIYFSLQFHTFISIYNFNNHFDILVNHLHIIPIFINLIIFPHSGYLIIKAISRIIQYFNLPDSIFNYINISST